MDVHKTHIDKVEGMEQLKPTYREFVREYQNNQCNGTQAYMKAYPKASVETAGVEACRLLKLPKIQKAIQRVEDRRDVKDIASRAFLLDEAHQTGLDASEDGQHRTRLAAIDIKAKLSGAYNQDAPDLEGYRTLISSLTINVNPAPPSQEEGERVVEGEIIEVSREGEDG